MTVISLLTAPLRLALYKTLEATNWRSDPTAHEALGSPILRYKASTDAKLNFMLPPGALKPYGFAELCLIVCAASRLKTDLLAVPSAFKPYGLAELFLNACAASRRETELLAASRRDQAFRPSELFFD